MDPLCLWLRVFGSCLLLQRCLRELLGAVATWLVYPAKRVIERCLWNHPPWRRGLATELGAGGWAAERWAYLLARSCIRWLSPGHPPAPQQTAMPWEGERAAAFPVPQTFGKGAPCAASLLQGRTDRVKEAVQLGGKLGNQGRSAKSSLVTKLRV